MKSYYFLATENFTTSPSESLGDLIKLYETIKDAYKSIVIYCIENENVTRTIVLKKRGN